MANLSDTYEKPEFDWSAISVGDYKLDHSQNFFANKENNENCQQQLIFSNCGTPRISRFKAEKEDLSLKESPAREPAPGSPVQLEEQKEQSVIMDKKEPKVEQRTIPNTVIYDNTESIPESESARVAPGNLRMQWSPIHREHEGDTASAPVPKAYAFKDLYESKRQEARRRQEQEDRQARQFHSRPVPNFKAIHKRIDDMVVVHRITVPTTPETVKYWQKCVERRQQAKMDQEDKEQQRQPGLEPVHTAHSRHKTFNLQSDQRVRDRRDFDSAVQERQLQKKKEQEEQRKRCEEEEIKEIRKKTVFKARPNPFK